MESVRSADLLRAQGRRRVRRRGTAALLGLAVVAVGGALVAFGLPLLLAGAVEQIAADVTDTPVAVGGAGVELAEGAVALRALRVANPPGFAARSAMEIGSLGLDPALGSLLRGDVVLERLAIRAPVVHVEVRADEGVNVIELRERIQASARAGEAGLDDAEPGDVAAAELSDMRIHVQTLSIAPVRVLVDASALGLEEPVELTLPDVTLRAVEGTPPELARTVMLAILDRSVAAFTEEVGLEQDEGLGAALRRGARELLQALPGL
jgi:hypothetical protein